MRLVDAMDGRQAAGLDRVAGIGLTVLRQSFASRAASPTGDEARQANHLPTDRSADDTERHPQSSTAPRPLAAQVCRM